MGSWGYKVFEDDTAYDALHKLKYSQSIFADIENYLDDVISAEYVWYNEGSYALVSAAIVENVINNAPISWASDEYLELAESLKQFDFSSIKQKAIQAIDVVISTHSELNEGWINNREQYCSWYRDKVEIRERLR